MKTSYNIGDRCKVGQEEGTVTAVVTHRNGYRVTLDDGRTLSVDEKQIGSAPAKPVHKMVEGPRETRGPKKERFP